MSRIDVDASNAKSYALRNALIALVEQRASADALQTSEVLRAVSDLLAVVLHEAANQEGLRGADRQALYRRATDFLIEELLEVEADMGKRGSSSAGLLGGARPRRPA